jgi:hypothetical protein
MANGLTMQDAEEAFETIKAAHAGDIMPELQAKTAKQVYTFCSALQFELYFQMTCVTAFKKAKGTSPTARRCSAIGGMPA